MPGEPVAEGRAQPVLAQGLDVDAGLPEDVEPRLTGVQVLGQGVLDERRREDDGAGRDPEDVGVGPQGLGKVGVDAAFCHTKKTSGCLSVTGGRSF